MSPVLLASPSAEPVSLADAKAWLRIDTADEDLLVASLVPAARARVEAATRRLLVTQTWRLSFDAWPNDTPAGPFGRGLGLSPQTIALPLAPVASIAALRVYDAEGVSQTVEAASYGLYGAPDEVRIVFSTSPPAPGRAVAGIEIDVVAGYGAPADVPSPLRQAILMLIAQWFENCGDAEAGGSEFPDPVAGLIAPFRRPRLA